MAEDTAIENVRSQSVLRNVPFIIDNNPFEWVGHEFVGWSTNKDATEADIQQESFAESGVPGATDLYAIWRPVTLTFTFDPNGGKFQDGSDEVYTMPNIEFGTFPRVDSTYLNPTRDGYEFNGWYDMNGGAPITKWAFYAMDNMDLVAKWTPVGGQQEEDIPQSPTAANPPSSTPEYNVISPNISSKKFKVIGSTNPCAKKVVVARFSGPEGGGLVHATSTLSTSCNPFTLGIGTFTYKCDEIEAIKGEYYWKIDLLPGIDRPKGQNLKVGSPSCPIWQMKGKKFLGWELRDQYGQKINGQPLGTSPRTYYYNNDTKNAKAVYINMRYAHGIYLDGCLKQGFDFYAKVAKI